MTKVYERVGINHADEQGRLLPGMNVVNRWMSFTCSFEATADENELSCGSLRLQWDVEERSRELIRQLCQAREATIIHGVPGSCARVGVSATGVGAVEAVAALKGRSSRRLQEISKVRFWRITKDPHLSTFIV